MLEAIEPDATATRFDRPTDRIPLRLSQLPHCSLGWAEGALAREERGELGWRYIPLNELAQAVAGVEGLPEFQALDELAQSDGMGKKSRKLLTYLYAYAQRYCEANREWEVESRSRVRKGRTVFSLNATPSLDDLDAPGVSTMVTMPHLSSRGPNGLWVVTRGAQHPLVRTFEGCEAWVLADDNDNPVLSLGNGCIETIDIFRSEKAVLAHIRGQSTSRRRKLRAKRIRNAGFQEVFDGCHMLDGDGRGR